MSVKTVMETVTPAKARQYLERNKNNRPKRMSRIQKYAVAMKEGKWKETHQGIAFDEEGNLIDGQNRLEAVVLSDCTIRMQVTTGLPHDCNVGIDVGANRNDVDRAHYAGFGNIGPRAAGACRAMLYAATGTVVAQGRSFGATLISQEDFLEYYAQHKKAIEFALQKLKSQRGLYNGSVLAAIARAYYHYASDRARLVEFIDTYTTGIANGQKDLAAIKLRDWCLNGKRPGRDLAEVYFKASTAIKAFMAHEPIDKLYAASEELFKAPGDRAWKKAIEDRKAYGLTGRKAEASVNGEAVAV